ncbi:Cell number regulator 8, partial [Linum perenne]
RLPRSSKIPSFPRKPFPISFVSSPALFSSASLRLTSPPPYQRNMTDNNNNNNNNAADTLGSSNEDRQESSPLLNKAIDEQTSDAKPAAAKLAVPGWTANGLPLGHGSVVGEPMGRAQWDSGICACLGRNDEFCSSDLEVCLIGSVAPCVLHGSNAERMGSIPGTFANHCLPYTGLYLIGNSVFGWNCLAPWFSYPSRTAMRRRFNLEASHSNSTYTLNGSCEALDRSCGCCGSCVEDDFQREQCETACDFTTHVFCHPCALCQEGREIRRRVPHPGFKPQPMLVMLAPGEQTMGRQA